MTRRSRAIALLVFALFLAGCHKDEAKQSTEKAERAIDQFLNAWTMKEPPDKFASGDKSLRGTDPDWQGGARLLSFLTAESKPVDGSPSRVRCRVALSLEEKSGKKVEKQVDYDVELGEPVVISRAKP
jgi:hypothetical protein